MSKMSDYLEGQLRAHIFRTQTFAKPSALYLALHTADPLDDASGAEANYTGYARVARAPLDANWTAVSATDGVTDNAAAVTFGICTAGSNTVTHFAVWDAASAGNMLVHGALTISQVIAVGVTPTFPLGSIDITFQ